jgi:hypothetical protein
MGQDDESVGSQFLSQTLAWGILVVMGLASEIGGITGVVVFVGYLAAVLYREYRLQKAKEASGNHYHWFSKETHELWNSKDTKGKVVYVLGNIIAAIIGILLAIYLFLTLAFWFFCSMADGQSCGVEVVFWGIGFL